MDDGSVPRARRSGRWRRQGTVGCVGKYLCPSKGRTVLKRSVHGARGRCGCQTLLARWGWGLYRAALSDVKGEVLALVGWGLGVGVGVSVGAGVIKL